MADDLPGNAGSRLRNLLYVLCCFSLALSIAAYLNRNVSAFKLPRTIEMGEVRPEDGNCYLAATGHPELSSHEQPSEAQVIEDGRPLPGPANALHDDIRKIGNGRYSFWHDYVYFSSSDNSDPRTNGRRYGIRSFWIIARSLAFLLYGISLTLLALVVVGAFRNSALRASHRNSQPSQERVVSLPARLSGAFRNYSANLWPSHGNLLFWSLVILDLVLLALSLFAFLSRSQVITPGWQTQPLQEIKAEIGNCYLAATYHSELSSHQQPSQAQVLENGKPVPGPANALHDDIRKIGNGRYSFWHDYVYFSASDNSDPRTNGRHYEFRYPWYFRRRLAYGLYGLSLALLALTLFMGHRISASRASQGNASSFFSETLASYRNRAINFRITRRNLLLRCLIVLAPVLLSLSVLAFLSRSQIITFGWTSQPLHDITAEIGNCNLAPTYHDELSSHEQPSRAQVLEDGKPLHGPANAMHDDIRKIGNGRYSFWHDYVYFSSSDNSDPRTNGRLYSILYPWAPSRYLTFPLYFVTALTVLFIVLLVASYRRETHLEFSVLTLVKSVCSVPYWLAAILLVSIYLITRGPFFVNYPVVLISPDSGSYMFLADTIRSHTLPLFSIRTPGYPLFLALVTSISDTWHAVILVQSLISLLSVLLLLFAVTRFRRSLALPTALALAGFLGSSQVLIYESSAISESLYASTIILAFGFFLMAFARRRIVFFVLASFCMAAAILVRPAGMYFLVIYLMVLGYLFWNRYSRSEILGFGLPMVILLSALCIYNKVTVGTFNISSFGEANLAGATVLFWEPDDTLPPQVNNALKDLPKSLDKAHFGPDQRHLLQDSWNPEALYPMFSNFYNLLINDGWGFGNRFGGGDYLSNRSNIRAVSLKAIEKHPVLYAKFVFTNLVSFYFSIRHSFDYYSSVAQMAGQHYWNVKRGYDLRVAKEYLHASPPPTIRNTGDAAHPVIELTITPLRSIHSLWQSFHWRIFQSLLWLIPYFVVLIAAIFQFIRYRGHHLGAFILIVLTFSVLGASLVISLVEIALERYAYPTQFVYYLCFVLIPFLSMKGD